MDTTKDSNTNSKITLAKSFGEPDGIPVWHPAAAIAPRSSRMRDVAIVIVIALLVILGVLIVNQHLSSNNSHSDSVLGAALQQMKQSVTAEFHVSILSSPHPGTARLAGAGSGAVNLSTGNAEVYAQYAGESALDSSEFVQFFIGDTVYLSALSDKNITNGTPWSASPISAPDSIIDLSSVDPTYLMRFLSGTGSDISPDGTSRINGVTSDKYIVRLNSNYIMSHAKRNTIGGKALIAVSQGMPSHFVVYIDKHTDTFNQIDMRMRLKISPHKTSLVKVEENFSDFGAPEPIKAPPPNLIGPPTSYVNNGY